MKKSNIIVLAVAAAVSVFLLALWFILGFNHVDSPVDPLVTLVWWIVIVAAVLIINKVEGTRRERIRSVYVGEGQLFNSELGLVSAQPGTVSASRTSRRRISSPRACWCAPPSTSATTRRSRARISRAAPALASV